MSIASCSFYLKIHRLCISSKKQQVPDIYVSGLKQDIILASIINYQFVINAKSQIKIQDKNSIKGEKKLLSHTPLRNIFHNI